jgi:hypothetical protein
MYADLEDAMLSSPPAERARYLGLCWQASDREARVQVMSHADGEGVDWLDLAWRAADAQARRRFVLAWCLELRTAIEVARHRGVLTNGALVKWQDLVRRLNDLERDSDPQLAEMARSLKALLGAPAKLTRGVSPAQRERQRGPGD